MVVGVPEADERQRVKSQDRVGEGERKTKRREVIYMLEKNEGEWSVPYV